MHKRTVDAILEHSKPLLRDRESDPKTPYWDMYTGERKCSDCLGDKYVKGIIGDSYDGGEAPEMDDAVHCEMCGCLMAHSLSDYGVYYELEVLSENVFDWSDADQCYEVARIIDGIANYEAVGKYGLIAAQVLIEGANLPKELKRIARNYAKKAKAQS